MQHNGNAIQLVPPPPLGFPLFQLVQSLAKGIIENLNKVEAELRQNTGVSLVIKQFEKPSQSHDELSPSSMATKSNLTDCPLCKNKKPRNDGKVPECRHAIGTPPNGLQQDLDKVSPTISHSSTTPTTAAVDTNNNQQVHDMILSQQTRPRPAINQYGHFMGETSFYCSLSSHLPLEQEKTHLDLVMRSPFALSTPVQPPHLTWESQLHLIDVYYTHIHPHLPLINKHDLLLELNHCNQGEPSFLSPLFFYALFARAAPFSSEPYLFINALDTNNMTVNQAVDVFATSCLQYANQLRDAYLHQPCPSTVVALLLMAGHLEQSKQHKEFSRVWMWAGEAFRMILDLGLHRYNSFSDLSYSSSSPSTSKKTGSSSLCNTTASSSSMESAEFATSPSSTTTMENSTFQQFGIRTFWAAFVTDRSLSLIYGRPFTLEEKDIDVPLPKCLEQDDDKETNGWMTTFHDLIDISKIMGRIAKFNYSPHSSQRGPIRHQDAMLSTLDSWITSLLKDFPPITEISQWTTQRQYLNTIRLLELYTLLILLHCPYIHEHAIKAANGSSSNPPRPSLDICSHTAMIITQLISDMSMETLNYLSKASPMVTYALMLALRIHLINASVTNDQKLGAFGEINFEHTLELLRKIPVVEVTGTMLNGSVDSLESQYKQRKSSILSGFNRPYNNKHPMSSSSPRSGPLDIRLRHTSTQSECSASSFDSDHGSSSKRPYSTDSDYFTAGFTNGNSHGGSSSSGSPMAKPMQKLKIIEVHPSKGKPKKLKSGLTTSNSNSSINTSEVDNMTNSNNSTSTSTNTSNSNSSNSGSGSGKTKVRMNERNGSGHEDERHHRHSPLSSRPGVPYTVEVQRESESTTPESTAAAEHSTHQQGGVTTTPMDITNNSNVTHQTLDGMVQYHQQQEFYRLQNQQKQSQLQHSMAASIFNNLSSSPTSTQQSFTSGGTTTPGMEYGMGTLFTLGDGLTGDHTSSLLYDTFFTSEAINTTTATTTTTSSSSSSSSMLPMTTTADTGLGYSDHPMDISASGVLPVVTDPLAVTSSSSTSSSSSSLHFPYPAYMESPHIVFNSSQSSPSTNHYIPHPYLPSR
ncbi:unnamed protein product [Absidia cylindrospora]